MRAPQDASYGVDRFERHLLPHAVAHDQRDRLSRSFDPTRCLLEPGLGRERTRLAQSDEARRLSGQGGAPSRAELRPESGLAGRKAISRAGRSPTARCAMRKNGVADRAKTGTKARTDVRQQKRPDHSFSPTVGGRTCGLL
jgi:hypothetical protein